VLVLSVSTIQGAPPPAPMNARFDAAGGSIGRDAGCTLVLPDAEKRISRRHALVSHKSGRFYLRSQGSAVSVIVNDTAIDYGAEVALNDGDRIEIGDFVMRVQDELQGAATVPPPRPKAAPAADILADFAPSAGADPFADLLGPVVSPPPPPPRSSAPVRAVAPAAPAPRSGGAIPDDFDPFSEPAAAPPPPAPFGAAPGQGAFADLVPERVERVDDLFGLQGGGDPFPAGHPLAASSASSAAGPVGIDDLLRPNAPVMPPSAAPTQRDDASELNAQVRLPQSAAPLMSPPPLPPPAAAKRPAAPPAPQPEADVAASGGGMMLSWEQGSDPGVLQGERTMVIRGGMPDRRRGDRRQDGVAPGGAPTAPAAAEQDQALVRALLEGLGLDQWPEDRAIDADTMRRVGRLLRTALQGTIDLLRARASIKSEVQAQMTMIVSRDNNPLKFSPNAEAALAHLLGPTQLGFTAGTRAALADVLARFDPASLEGKLAGKSMLDSLLPANRKARLWDLFTERFGQISAEAEEDFQRLFGKEFLRAYEAQVAKMTMPERKGKEPPQ
jgi:FHA domain-containing protein